MDSVATISRLGHGNWTKLDRRRTLPVWDSLLQWKNCQVAGIRLLQISYLISTISKVFEDRIESGVEVEYHRTNDDFRLKFPPKFAIRHKLLFLALVVLIVSAFCS